MNSLSHDEASILLSSLSGLAKRLDCSFEDAVRHVVDRLGEVPVARNSTRVLASDLLRMRRHRSDILQLRTLRDPAWDMLLDLYAQGGRSEGTKVTALCAASGVPQTTALRHLAKLEEQRLVERQIDHSDLRRSKIVLTPEATSRLDRLLGMLQGSA